MASIARKNLFEDIPRFLVAQGGIMFAVTLVAIQSGIFNGFIRSTALVVDESEADIWVASDEMLHFELTHPIPVERLLQARDLNGVARAEALMLQSGRWRDSIGTIAPLRLIGFDPAGRLFQPWNVTAGSISDLQQPYTVILDESTTGSLNIDGVGATGEINSLPVTVVGLTQGTQSIASSAYTFTSLRNANAYANSGVTSSVRCQVQPSGEIQCSNRYEKEPESEDAEAPPTPRKLRASDLISYVLIEAEAGKDIAQLKQRLEETLPGTRAYTREEMADITRNYWSTRTGIGFILGLGAGVGIIVGVAIVGQILYSSVSDRIKEFGTLKAMGASNRMLYGIIIEQALWMSVLGYAPGMLLCWGIATWTSASVGITILITPVTAISVFGITVAMCVGSAFFAIQKVTRVDPAIVFKA
jgi:putative ABC transport system permease protein